eukprot:TRINITY_DN7040_c1_g1_i1.p1 TRINITY_DN7040_c1_g1~~TRINITY_DN7040_c1_g1_i1.p1  ORF type:complete len:514 (-),score=81.20 TRINITY_DN7040_c1_g1_i1:293-1696(-)
MTDASGGRGQQQQQEDGDGLAIKIDDVAPSGGVSLDLSLSSGRWGRHTQGPFTDPVSQRNWASETRTLTQQHQEYLQRKPTSQEAPSFSARRSPPPPFPVNAHGPSPSIPRNPLSPLARRVPVPSPHAPAARRGSSTAWLASRAKAASGGTAALSSAHTRIPVIGLGAAAENIRRARRETVREKGTGGTSAEAELDPFPTLQLQLLPTDSFAAMDRSSGPSPSLSDGGRAKNWSAGAAESPILWGRERVEGGQPKEGRSNTTTPFPMESEHQPPVSGTPPFATAAAASAAAAAAGTDGEVTLPSDWIRSTRVTNQNQLRLASPLHAVPVTSNLAGNLSTPEDKEGSMPGGRRGTGGASSSDDPASPGVSSLLLPMRNPRAWGHHFPSAPRASATPPSPAWNTEQIPSNETTDSFSPYSHDSYPAGRFGALTLFSPSVVEQVLPLASPGPSTIRSPRSKTQPFSWAPP